MSGRRECVCDTAVGCLCVDCSPVPRTRFFPPASKPHFTHLHSALNALRFHLSILLFRSWLAIMLSSVARAASSDHSFPLKFVHPSRVDFQTSRCALRRRRVNVEQLSLIGYYQEEGFVYVDDRVTSQYISMYLSDSLSNVAFSFREKYRLLQLW